MRRWRERICRRADLIVTPSAAILPAARRRRRSSNSNGVRTPTGSAPGAAGAAAFHAAGRHAGGLRRRVPVLARRDPPGRRRSGNCAQRGRRRRRRGLHRRRPGTARPTGRRAGPRGGRLHRCAAARPDAGVPCGGRHRRGAVRSRRNTRRCALGFYWSPLKIFEYMAAGLPVVAPAIDRAPAGSWNTSARACSTIPSAAAPWRMRSRLDRPGRRQRPARPPASEPSASTVGRRTAATLEAAHSAAPRRSYATPCASSWRPMPFRRVCGGSGWSTYELARGLRARGHAVTIVQPSPGSAPRRHRRAYDGFTVLVRRRRAADSLRPELLQERAAVRRRSRSTCPRLIARSRIDIIHGQHVMTTVPAIDAATPRGIPSSPPCATTGPSATGPI